MFRSAKQYSLRQILLKKISLMPLSKAPAPQVPAGRSKKCGKHSREEGRLGRLGGGVGG
jgi:hypothetical protein